MIRYTLGWPPTRPVYHLLGGPLDGATVTLRADQTDDGVPPERITTCGGAYVPSTNDPTTYVWSGAQVS